MSRIYELGEAAIARLNEIEDTLAGLQERHLLKQMSDDEVHEAIDEILDLQNFPTPAAPVHIRLHLICFRSHPSATA